MSGSGQFSGETAGGRWQRQTSHFTDTITADGSSGFPVAAGRYHLYVSLACPWAHRQIIVRELKGLHDALPMTIVDPWRDERGWRFAAAVDAAWPEYRPDPVRGAAYLSELYLATDPAFAGRVTVPCIWDTVTERIVTNDFLVIDQQLNREFDAVARHPEVDLEPRHLAEEIAELSEAIYLDVNNGVYKAGFATEQAAYEEAYSALFARLDFLEEHLAHHRYLAGGRLTLADIRLFTTLVRFDAAYHGHFKCNRQKLTEFPHLWAYARDLYQTPGFGSTADLAHIKRHYYASHERINPTRIVPLGPEDDWLAPHGRETLRSG